jgi:hypothetical protein
MRAAATALAAFAAAAAPAAASTSQESIFMDDPKVVYSAPDSLEGTLAEMKALGADRIRVSVFWHLLAPAPDSETRPFPAGAGADPRSYSSEKWDRYDRIVTTAQSLGLKLLFNATSPAPLWATRTPPRSDIERTYRPDEAEFKDFVKALGTRYSGSFRDEAPRQDDASVFDDCEPTPNFPVPPPICPSDDTDPTPSNPNPPNTGPTLPRVDTWSAWNEPNMPGWLTPQSHEDNNDLPASPHIYRSLADAMYSALLESGHGSDTILIGETAPRGASEKAVTQSLPPLLFIRELYCLDEDFRPFGGDAAASRGCPDGGVGFRAAHPALFDATAFAHHPYAFEARPSTSDRTNDNAVLKDLGRLTRTLDLALGRHGSPKRFKVWLTEYGYQTDPPDGVFGVSWKTQAAYVRQSFAIARAHPRIDLLLWFLLRDEPDPARWQSGLISATGERKPSFESFRTELARP